MTTGRCTVIAAAMCALLVVPASAQAQESLRPDPNSPAGIEYALPLERAREDAAGAGKSKGRSEGRKVARSSSGTPLFGAGIIPSKNAGAAAAHGKRSTVNDAEVGSQGSRSTAGSGEAANETAAGTDPALKRSALTAAEAGSGSATLRIAGIALAVLAVGGLLGLLLRRGLGQSGS